MEILYLLIGLIIGALIIYFVLKSSKVSQEDFQTMNNNFIKNQSELENANSKVEELKAQLQTERIQYQLQIDNLNDARNEFVKLNSDYQSLKTQFETESERLRKTDAEKENLLEEKQMFIAANAELNAQNQSFKELLQSQKDELKNLQEQTKNQFENLANKILEEKTEKFTTLNQQNLKNILEPFQEKMVELKNKVNEAYDKENKERFSLAEKVKELAELNQQISEDAKKLTRALKGESKTQGNWGEMILESILEKSGLVKGREYFLEYQLKDENNKTIFSEFSGKKMRPDAVIKYPDERNVIIDSKTSLTAYMDWVDETDPDVQQIKINQHLNSVKNHINELSRKAYDDYGKALDFVMMFIPSEAAYIAAMQADPNLWNYAYEKRILLLNPSNLITSLKLIADLWKREHQNRNTKEIADRGAKLYDKFVSFVENLQRIGKNLDQTKNTYDEAFKQLSTGNDNLIIQTQKLKKLGLKNKKDLPQGLIDDQETELIEE